MNACDFKMVLTYNSYTCTLCQGASYTIYRASLEFYTVNNYADIIFDDCMLFDYHL